MNPRKATVSVYYNGTNVDSKIAGYLKKFTFKDISSGESDSLSLSINDKDRKWINEWMPTKGDLLSASIKLENWNSEGDTKETQCGSFMIDDYGFSGTPIVLAMEAVAIPVESGFKQTARTKTYENTTLQNVAKEIAARAGVTCYYEAPNISIEKIEQSEKDDCSFLNETVVMYGYAMKVYNNKIVIFSEATYESKNTVAELGESDIEPNWSWETTLDGIYTGARYEYTNSDKNLTFIVDVGSGSNILKVTDATNNLEEAERVTLAKINAANKGDTAMALTLTVANKSIIATSCIEIVGLGKLNGRYYVEGVTWEIGSGCKQKLEVRKIGARFTKATSSATSVASESDSVSTEATYYEPEVPAATTQDLVKGGTYTLTSTKKGYYTAAEALAGCVSGGNPSGTRVAGTYTIFNISQGMLNLTTQAGVPGSWINPN